MMAIFARNGGYQMSYSLRQHSSYSWSIILILITLQPKMVKQKKLSKQPRNSLKETLYLILFYWFTDQLCQPVADEKTDSFNSANTC